MGNKLYHEENSQCINCKEPKIELFKYIESKAGENIIFENYDVPLLVFILSGQALVSCNEFHDVLFQSHQMCFLPIAADCTWKIIEDSSAIVLRTTPQGDICMRESGVDHLDYVSDLEPEFTGLPIKPPLIGFLNSILAYLNDGGTCPVFHYIKENELAILIRAYYSVSDLARFFMPEIKNRDGFQLFVMKNYRTVKGVQEFVHLSGMSLSAFNRKFKTLFGMSPYQWMINQKSKHVLHAILARDQSIANIMREFNFSDASHFNRYCKTMFGASPSELRGRSKKKAP